jgi:1-acyl-sn-glycerol-3-phosphate acyltransferase
MSFLYRLGYSLSLAAAHCFFNYRILHRERLLENEGVLIVANHASYLDPPLIGIGYRKSIWFLARKTLFRGFGGWLYPRLNCIPVDQEGSDVAGLKTIIRLLRGGERVLLFPEGSRSIDGQLDPGEPGVGLVVAKARVPVQPVRIFGTHDVLPRGSAIPRPGKIRVVVGEPLRFSDEELAGKGKAFYQELSDRIMQAIAKLELPPDL